MKHLKLLDKKTAKAAGFRPLTIAYELPQERPMLDNVIADLRRGNINHRLVKSKTGVAVWRGGVATSQHLTPALCPSRTRHQARRGSKKPGLKKCKSRLTSAATKGKRS